jgi:hypothetical protein
VVTNVDVVKLVGGLSSRDTKRGALFDGFLAEHGLTGMACPLRDRVESWPREIPIVPKPR